MSYIQWILSLMVVCSISVHSIELNRTNYLGECVIDTKKITIPGYPEAFNPSLTKSPWGTLLTFRVLPHPDKRPWISLLGIVILNDQLEIIAGPQFICTRNSSCKIAQQSEDARIFLLNGKVYLTYNDNMEVTNPNIDNHRDIYLAELVYLDGVFSTKTPLKLYHTEHYNNQKWQKNWVPFEWNRMLLMGYTINPHEVLLPNLDCGSCQVSWSSKSTFDWGWGPLRGGTPAQLVDGEYLAFFHSSCEVKSDVSGGKKMWHYFMGAYTFAPEPPFNLRKIGISPLIAKGFYTPSNYEKRVVFPGGFIVDDDIIHVAYGKDDREVWIVTIDKGLLLSRLTPLSPILQ